MKTRATATPANAGAWALRADPTAKVKEAGAQTTARRRVPALAFITGALLLGFQSNNGRAECTWFHGIETNGTMTADNLARMPGAKAFAKDVMEDAHRIGFLNDGQYGDKNAWIADSRESFCGISFSTTQSVCSVAFGRDSTGVLADRYDGYGSIQYTTPQYTEGADPSRLSDFCWTTIGNIRIVPGRARRQRFCFPSVNASAVRLLVRTDSSWTGKGGMAIDELEIYGERSADVEQPFKPLVAAGEVPPPTNETVPISMGKTRAVSYDNQGLQLCVEGSYPPKTRVTDFSDADLRALLETVKMYELLTSFRKGGSRTEASAPFEASLRQIWSREPSFQNRIQTRLEILGLMRRYSDAAQSYASSAGLANAYGSQAETALQAAANAQATEQAITKRAEELFNRPANSAYEYTRDFNNAIRLAGPAGNARNAANAAEEAAARAGSISVSAGQDAAKQLQECQVRAAQLAKYDIMVAGSPPFSLIPPLSLKSDVDAERVATPSVTQASPPGGSKAPAGNPAVSDTGNAGFLEKLAAEGSADAQFALAINYLYGSGGVEKDASKARTLLKAAAAQGYAAAKSRLEELDGK